MSKTINHPDSKYSQKSIWSFISDSIIKKTGLDIPTFTYTIGKREIQYVAVRDLYQYLDVPANTINNKLGSIRYFFDRKKLTKKEYRAQAYLPSGRVNIYKGPPLNIISVEDAIQVLVRLQSEDEKNKLIRKLIWELSSLHYLVRETNNKAIATFMQQMIYLDRICYEYICDKRNGPYKYARYENLQDETLWGLAKYTNYVYREQIGQKLPEYSNTAFHHWDRPYKIVYPFICSKGDIITKEEHAKIHKK